MSEEVASEMPIEATPEGELELEGEGELEVEGEVEEQAEEVEDPPPPPGQDPLILTPTIYNMVISKVERTLMRRLAQKEGENPGLVAVEIRALIGDLKRPSEETSAEEEVEPEPHLPLNQYQRFGRDPFSRVLVEPFAHLFLAPDGPNLADGALSRRFLSGYFDAIHLMLGAEVYGQFQSECVELVDELSSDRDDFLLASFWSRLYEDERARKITLEAYLKIASHFGKYKSRKRWILQIINDDIDGQGSSGVNLEEADWRLTEEHLVRILASVFLDPKSKKLMPGYEATLKEWPDADVAAKIKSMLEGLNEDVRNIRL